MVIKNIILIIAAILLFTCGKAQPNEDGIIKAGKKPFFTEVDIKRKEKGGVIMYSHIIVKDCRADSSKMGYVTLELKGKPQRITFPVSGEEYINKIFNEAIQPLQRMDTLVVLLNNIWFNETRTTATNVHKHLFGPEKLVSSCYINAVFFAKREDQYIFIGNFDSVSFKKGEWLPNNCNKLLEKSLINLVSSADLQWKRGNEIETAYTKTQIDSLIDRKSDYPILKANKLNGGVYFTFNDFLNNNPANINFTVISDIRNNIKYAGKERQDQSWGYCDGEKIFMHIDKGFYRLNRAGNTFEVLGPAAVEYVNTFMDKTISVAVSYFPTGLFDFGPFAQRGEYSIEYFKFFHLNMKNGILY